MTLDADTGAYLAADGTRSWSAGAHDLYLFLTDDGEVELTIFERSGGRALGTDPQVLAPEHGAVHREARAAQRAITDALAAQKASLEEALADQHAWSYAAWRGVFGAHPLMAHLARRLVWVVDEGHARVSAMVAGDTLMSHLGVLFTPADDARLRLLHPAVDDAAALGAWRDRIVAQRLVQPFKQVFREVLRPGPGEAASDGLSGRYEGVQVRLRPLASLLGARGWAGLSGQGQAGWVATRELAASGLTARLTVQPLGSQREPRRRRVVLGRVGFLAPGAGGLALPLAQVPAVAYAEVLRDLALGAVAAASPTEAGSEAGGRRAAVLADVAIARADLVSALLPQLGLAGVVRVAGGDALVDCAGQIFRLDLGSGEVTLDPTGRRVDLDGLERADLPLYFPHEGTDTPARAVLASRVWLAKFGRACAERGGQLP